MIPNGNPMQGQFFYNPAMMGMGNNNMMGMGMGNNNMMGMGMNNMMGMGNNNMMGMGMNNMMGMGNNNMMGMGMNNMGMMGAMLNNGFANPMVNMQNPNMQNNMVYNNIAVPNQIPNQNINPNPTSQGDGEKSGKLPRGNYVNGDVTPVQGEDMINIAFDASTGVKTIVTVKKSTPLKEILKKYMDKIGLPHNLIGTEIFFLFNGSKVDVNSEATPKELKYQNMVAFTVFDQGNVIGA